MVSWQLAFALVIYLGAPVLYVTCTRLRQRRRTARWERAHQIRNGRLGRIATGEAPFSPQMVPAPERQEVLGRHGMTCDQWYETVVADYRAIRRDRLPSCADYRREFGQALARYYYEQQRTSRQLKKRHGCL